MTKQPSGPAIASHLSTVAEIRQTRLELFEKQRALQNEAATNYSALKGGSPPSRPLSDHERRIACHIELLMNGSTPAHFLMPVVSRDDQISCELAALAYVDRHLSRQETAALEREAEQWVIEHAPEWRQLCRAIVLAAVRLAGLEERAREMLAAVPALPVTGLALGGTIGSSSLLGVGDPLLDLRSAALAEGVVTQRELTEASDV